MMIDKESDDESLGTEQLPQDELEASPGDGDIEVSQRDRKDEDVATAPADKTDS